MFGSLALIGDAGAIYIFAIDIQNHIYIGTLVTGEDFILFFGDIAVTISAVNQGGGGFHRFGLDNQIAVPAKLFEIALGGCGGAGEHEAKD